MTSRPPIQHAVANPQTRYDIARAVQAGISVEQLAAEFNISPATVRTNAREFEQVQRTIRRLDTWERESIALACRRGARRRWERELGVEVVRQLLGEA